MKLLSFLVLAIVNIWMVAAIPNKENDNGYFQYWITGNCSGQADIVGLGKKYENAKEIEIPAYFELQGCKYYVRNINYGALANNKFEKVTFNYNPKNVNLVHSSFYNNKYLKTVVFNTSKVTIDSNAFNGCSDIFFDGTGVPTLVTQMSKDLLKQWGLPVGYSGYDEASTAARNKKSTDLYKLAKKINESLNVQAANAGNNVLSILIFRSASTRGYHMLFRELALTMGVSEKYILTVSDAHCAFWTYVKFDHDKWYDEWLNVDIYYYDFKKYTGTSYPSDFYMKNAAYSKYLNDHANVYLFKDHPVHKRPDQWYVYIARYGTTYENLHEQKVLIDDYIRQKNLGGDRP